MSKDTLRQVVIEIHCLIRDDLKNKVPDGHVPDRAVAFLIEAMEIIMIKAIQTCLDN